MTKAYTNNYELKDLNVAEDSLQATLFLPENLMYFDGHFDDMPILPGVVQTHWAINLAKAHFNISGDFKGIQVIKFTQIITPSSTVKLVIDYNSQKNVIDFQYSSDKGDHSSGKVSFS